MTIRVTALEKLPTPAVMERMALSSAGPGIGVLGIGDLKAAAGSGLASTVTAGRARVRANQAGAGTDSGVQEVLLEAADTVIHAVGNGSNPRIDSVYAQMQDAALAGVVNLASVVLAAGTPTAGATLDNRNGAATAPLGATLLSDMLVPIGAASAAAFTYRDRRQFASMGVIPPTRVLADQVGLAYPWGFSNSSTFDQSQTNYQTSCLVYLPRPITATKIRWSYWQGPGAAMTGNYNFGIYDSSGRKIVETGAVAFTGGINTLQSRAETIASTVFEAGAYYLAFGCASLGAAANTEIMGLLLSNGSSVFANAGPNQVGFKGSGGTTLPTVLDHVDIDGAFTPQLLLIPAATLSST